MLLPNYACLGKRPCKCHRMSAEPLFLVSCSRFNQHRVGTPDWERLWISRLAPKTPICHCSKRAVDELHPHPIKAVFRWLRLPSPTSKNSNPFLVWISFIASPGMDGCHSRWPCSLWLEVETALPTDSKRQQERKANYSLNPELQKASN